MRNACITLIATLGLGLACTSSYRAPPEGERDEVKLPAITVLAAEKSAPALNAQLQRRARAVADAVGAGYALPGRYNTNFNTEAYDLIVENVFLGVADNPLSTFSIDVDRASYSNVRRFINQGQRPPKDAVRIEELINYFTYDYADPDGEHPFSVTTEVTDAPWNTLHKLVRIGIQGERVDTHDLPPSNLVFLLDVSGSMQSPDKLPLLKASFRMLVNELRPHDRVAIVVYAGAAGLVLPSTPGDEKG